MARHDDTDDLEGTGTDKTGAIRRVRSELEKQEWKRELDVEADKRRDKALQGLREDHKKLKESLFDPKDGIITGLKDEIAGMRQVIGFIKWGGGVVGTLMAAGIAAALFGG